MSGKSFLPNLKSKLTGKFKINKLKKDECPGCRKSFEVETFDNHTSICEKFKKFESKLDKKLRTDLLVHKDSKRQEKDDFPKPPPRSKDFGGKEKDDFPKPPPRSKSKVYPEEMISVVEPPKNKYRTPFYYYSYATNHKRPIEMKKDSSALVLGVQCDDCKDCPCKNTIGIRL